MAASKKHRRQSATAGATWPTLRASGPAGAWQWPRRNRTGGARVRNGRPGIDPRSGIADAHFDVHELAAGPGRAADPDGVECALEKVDAGSSAVDAELCGQRVKTGRNRASGFRHADSISFKEDDVETLGDFAAEPLPDAQGRIVNLFLMLPEADTAFLEAATGRPDFPVREDTNILDIGAGDLIEDHRLLLHGALSVLGGGPGFAERVEGPRALSSYRCESNAAAAR